MASDTISCMSCGSLGCSRRNARLLNDLKTFSASALRRAAGPGEAGFCQPGMSEEIDAPIGGQFTASLLRINGEERGIDPAPTAAQTLHSFMTYLHAHLPLVNI